MTDSPTLPQCLAAGYQHAMRGGADPAQATADAIPRADLVAKAAELQGVTDRCHISRIWLGFIQRVLALPQ